MLIGLRGFVLLHPSVTHNLKASLIFRKRSEPEPTPSPDPAAPQAARDLASRRYSHSRRVQARRLIDLNAPNSVSTPQSGGARSALSASYDSDGTMPWLVSTSDDDSEFEDFGTRPNSLQSRSQGASTTPSAGHVRRGAPNERAREEEDEAHVQCGQRQGNMLFEQLQPSTRSMLCWHTVQVYPDAASLHKDVGSAPQPYNTSTINMLRHQKWVRRCPQFSKLVPSKRAGTITEKFCCSHHITTGCPATFRSVLHPDGTAHLQVRLYRCH